MDEVELMPCPFCGEKNADIDELYDDERMVAVHGDWFVACSSCITWGPSASTREEAIESWNRRADARQEVKRGN